MRKIALLAGQCPGLFVLIQTEHNIFTAKSNLKHVLNESFYENMVMRWLHSSLEDYPFGKTEGISVSFFFLIGPGSDPELFMSRTL